LRTYPATARALGADFFEEITFSGLTPASTPPRYSLATLTGVPGYAGATLPVIVTVTTGGLAVYGFDGYLYGAVTALGAVGPGTTYAEFEGNSVAFYYAALGVATALPSRLTFSALVSALGGAILENLPGGSALVVAPGVTVTPNGGTLTLGPVTASYATLVALGYPGLVGVVGGGA
jgi:hypothetical protein